VLRLVKAKLPPDTLATPPLREDEAKVCPYVIPLAVGVVVIVGVALLLTTRVTVAVVLL